MWLVHMCVPTTPLLSHLTTAQENQMRRVNTRCQKNSDEFRKKSKPGGSNQASWPKIFEKFPKHPHWGQSRPSLNLCKRATKDGHRSRPAGPTCRPISGPLRVFVVCHFYSLLLPGFVQIHSKSCQTNLNKTSE